MVNEPSIYLSDSGVRLGIAWLGKLVPKGSEPANAAAPYIYAALQQERWEDARLLQSKLSPDVMARYHRSQGELVDGPSRMR